MAAKKKEIAPQVLSKRGTENTFIYHAVDKPLSSIEAISPAKAYKEVIYPSEKYFSTLREPFDGYYYYSSGGIELLQVKDVFTEESLRSLTFSAHLHSFGLGQVNYWLGKENVTAYTHYDTSYNLHMVAYGRKKFIIFPPEAYHELKLYPCLHPFYRQVQSDIYSTKFQDVIERLNGVEVFVNPGEVLYIPPYWFHSVITMTTTVSFNIWSQSEAFIAMEDIYAAPIPFEEEWGRPKLMQALNYFIKRLVESLLIQADVHGFMQQNVIERYKPFLEQLSSITREEQKITTWEYCLEVDISDIFTFDVVVHIDAGIAKFAVLFRTIQPQPVLEINLANYIEHITWRILGTDDIALMPFYFLMCFP